MALTVPIPLALGRFKRLPQRSGEVWQGGLVRLPGWIDHPTDPDGDPSRPVGALWVSLRTGFIHLAIPDEGVPATPELALAALLEFGLKGSKGLEGRPSRIEVQDAVLRDALSEPLSRLATAIDVVADMPAVRAAVRTLEMEADGGRRLPGALEAPGVTPDRLRAFADAAARFYEARPWDHVTDEDLIAVEGPQGARGMTHISVLGHGGQEFGLAFFESRQAFERFLDSAADPHPRPDRAHGLTFGPIDRLPFGDADAWEDHELPVAGKRAYPLAADLRGDGSVRRPDASELTAVEALLRALAATTEDDLDTGRWHLRVQTFDGPVALTLTLPYLLEAELGQPSRAPRLAALPRVAERGRVRISRLLESRPSASLNDVNEELGRARDQRLFDAPQEASAGRDLTTLERAQELAYDAMEAEGRVQIKRARQALALSPDCADAWVILGDNASVAEVALDRYERGVEAGARAIGPERFAALAGEFWEHLDTRPYMRARLALAQILCELGRDQEALEHYRELLRLNPNDDQGVRYLLVVALLELNRNDEAGVLLDQYDSDIQALWPYARVLWRFRTEAGTAVTSAALDEALHANPDVVKYLLVPESIPPDRPSHFALGSKDEAAYIAEALGEAFQATVSAALWLQSQTSSRRGRTSKRPPRRSPRG